MWSHWYLISQKMVNQEDEAEKRIPQKFTSGGQQHLTGCQQIYYELYYIGHEVLVPYRENPILTRKHGRVQQFRGRGFD